MRLLDDLGLFSTLRRAAASKFEKGEFDFGGRQVTLVDFRRLRQPHPYSGLVPRWDLLDLLADAGQDEPTFTCGCKPKSPGGCATATRLPACSTRVLTAPESCAPT